MGSAAPGFWDFSPRVTHGLRTSWSGRPATLGWWSAQEGAPGSLSAWRLGPEGRVRRQLRTAEGHHARTWESCGQGTVSPLLIQVGSEGAGARTSQGERPSRPLALPGNGWPLGHSKLLTPPSQLSCDVDNVSGSGRRGLGRVCGPLAGGGVLESGAPGRCRGRERSGTQGASRGVPHLCDLT